jgi:hypothetical protein
MQQIPFMMLGTVEISAAAHPNEMKLRGTLLRLDEPSTKAPHGSKGHRIMVTSVLAKQRVATLVNMGLNYAPSLQEHAQRRKVGVITKAWIDGKDLKVEATVWKRDFPEAERDLKRSGLGMSMEIGDVQVEDQNAAVWILSDFCFLGATVLEKTSAAYFKTHAIAAARQKERTDMAEKKKVRTITTTAADLRELVAGSSEKLAEDAVKRIMKPYARQQGEILARLDEIEASVLTLNAKAGETSDDDEEDASACDPTKMKYKGVKAKKAKKDDEDDEDDEDEDEDDDDDDEMDSEIDKGDEEDLGPEEDSEDDEPGKLNREAKNKGNKTTSEDKVGKTVSSARLKASLRREREAIEANATLAKQLKAMRRELKEVKELAAQASESMGRRSVALPGEVQSLLRKGGIDVKDLQASGEKLTVEQVDALLANVGGLPPMKRMELKGLLAHNGLMEEGRVIR